MVITRKQMVRNAIAHEPIELRRANILKNDSNQRSSLAKKILTVALIILLAVVVWFSLIGSEPSARLHAKPISARNLTGNHLSSFSNYQYCILPTEIESKQQLKKAVKQKNYQTQLTRVKKDRRQVARYVETIKENCQKIVGGICPIKNGDVLQTMPEPYDYTRMEKTLKWLDKTHTKPLASYTFTGIRTLLCGINQRLKNANTMDCSEAQMISNGILNGEHRLIHKSTLPELTNAHAVNKFLEKEEPLSVSIYASIANKINRHTLPEVKDILENQMDTEERKFIANYGIEVINGSGKALDVLNALSIKVEKWIGDLANDPYELASQSYIYCVMNAPFENHNKETAYTFMNFLLTRRGMKPAFFQGFKSPILEGKNFYQDSSKFKEFLVKVHQNPINTTELLDKCQKKVEECSKNLFNENVEKCDLTITVHNR